MSAPLLSLAIMAHPSREHFVSKLLPQLPGATVVWDEVQDRWDTGRRSMLAHDPSARFHLVFQDDGIPCSNFVKEANKALSVVPPGYPVVAFYMGRTGRNQRLNERVLRRARHQGRCWIPFDGPWWGVAVAVSVPFILPMIEWCDKRNDVLNYDRRMARYFGSIGKKCLYSIPSIVEHRTGPDSPSLIAGRRSNGRTAMWFQQVVQGEWSGRMLDAPIVDPTPKDLRHTLGAP